MQVNTISPASGGAAGFIGKTDAPLESQLMRVNEHGQPVTLSKSGPAAGLNRAARRELAAKLRADPDLFARPAPGEVCRKGASLAEPCQCKQCRKSAKLLNRVWPEPFPRLSKASKGKAAGKSGAITDGCLTAKPGGRGEAGAARQRSQGKLMRSLALGALALLILTALLVLWLQVAAAGAGWSVNLTGVEYWQASGETDIGASAHLQQGIGQCWYKFALPAHGPGQSFPVAISGAGQAWVGVYDPAGQVMKWSGPYTSWPIAVLCREPAEVVVHAGADNICVIDGLTISGQ